MAVHVGGGRLQVGGEKQGREGLPCMCKGEEGGWIWGDENMEC